MEEEKIFGEREKQIADCRRGRDGPSLHTPQLLPYFKFMNEKFGGEKFSGINTKAEKTEMVA
jgi:hypothetical protein